jgi:hypothetical protein
MITHAAVGGVHGVTIHIKLHFARSRELGLSEEDAMFIATSISGYQPEQPPDVVLALHACDTATDDALALGVKLVSGFPVAWFCSTHSLHLL